MQKETANKVRVGREKGKKFWTARGLRQSCALSPYLFYILIADIEEEMKKGK